MYPLHRFPRRPWQPMASPETRDLPVEGGHGERRRSQLSELKLTVAGLELQYKLKDVLEDFFRALRLDP